MEDGGRALLRELRDSMAKKNHKEAKEIAGKLIEHDIHSSIAWANLSIIAEHEGSIIYSIECLETAISKDKSFGQAYNNLAIIYNKIGKKERAMAVLERAIKNCPEREDLRNTLGCIHQECGNAEKALEKFDEAIKINRRFGPAYLNRAILREAAGLVDEAIKDVETMIEITPGDARAQIEGYRFMKRVGQLNKALAALESASQLADITLEERETIADAYYKEELFHESLLHYGHIAKSKPDKLSFYNMACCLEKLGKHEQAKLNYLTSLKYDGSYICSLINLGNLEKEQGNYTSAIALIKNALSEDPSSINGHFSIADAYYAAKKYDLSRPHYQSCIEAGYNKEWALLRLGNIAAKKNDARTSKEYYEAALSINPSLCEAWYNLGIILHRQEDYAESELCFAKVLELRPTEPEAYLSMGHQQQLQGKLEEAIGSYKAELAINPSCSQARMHLVFNKLQVCDWTDYEKDLELLLNCDDQCETDIAPWQALSLSDDPELELKIAQEYAKKNEFMNQGESLRSIRSRSAGKISIGFFSSDFYNHATLYLIEGLFEEINKEKFNVYLYDYGLKADEYTEKLLKGGCIYKNISCLDDDSIESTVLSDNLDIAVDLKGYTSGARLEIFKRRIAARHISFLGYPGTSGSDIYDYIIGDRIVAPDWLSKSFSEKVITLEGCYQPNNPYRQIDNTYSCRESNHLPKNSFVYCCFNACYKIKPAEFSVWMNILAQTDSVLWVLRTNPLVDKNLREEAKIRGVDPERIIFTGKLDINQHLGRHQSADLQLDTFNVNAHTTASDSIFAGLPILTKIGKTFSSRVCASILAAAGLDELITYTDTEYEEKAIYMANHPEYTNELKQLILKNRKHMNLFDIKGYARRFEESIEKCLNNW